MGEAWLRPPWALPEEKFLRTCTRCAECIKACPENILFKGTDGYPQVTFTSRGCTLCGKCVVACADNALYRTRNARAWSATLAVSPDCLTAQGITCRVCADICPAQALSLTDTEAAPPRLDTARCTACGMCVNPCPVQAISISLF